MQRKFVIGDIHGAWCALRQCFEKSSFDYDHDLLICLGDVADGWPETKKCVEELMQIKNLVYLLGNHDWWTMEWMRYGIAEEIWLDQGGHATIDSYKNEIPVSHLKFFENAKLYHKISNSVFVHAGILPGLALEKHSYDILLWDRKFVELAVHLLQDGINKNITGFDEVYIGHTPILSDVPIKACEVWLMDTGAGWSGRLSMMNIETKEVFVSERVPSLYPGVEGRKKPK